MRLYDRIVWLCKVAVLQVKKNNQYNNILRKTHFSQKVLKMTFPG